MATTNLITKLFDRILIQPAPIVTRRTAFGNSVTETVTLAAGFPAEYYAGTISKSFGNYPWVLTLITPLSVVILNLSDSDVIVNTTAVSSSSYSSHRCVLVYDYRYGNWGWYEPYNCTESTSNDGIRNTSYEITYPAPYFIDSPNIGWNAAALSNSAFGGNGEISFSCPITSTGVVAGLNEYSGRLNSNYSDINHGFIMRSGKYQIIEGNAILAGEVSFIEADVFKVERFEGEVNYYVNDVLIRNTTTTTESDLYFDVSLYLSGDSLADASIANITDTQYGIAQDSVSAGSMSTTGDITIGDEVLVSPLVIAATSSLTVTYTDNLFTQTMAAGAVLSVVQPLSINGGGQIASTLPFTSKASDYVYAEGSASIEAFTGEGGYGGVVINIGISVNTPSPLTSQALGTNGQLNTPSTTSLIPYFDSLAADHDYGEGVGEVEPFTSFAGEFIPVRNGDARILTGIGTQGSGTLLESGKHLLTAAHVVDGIVNLSDVQTTFNTHISISIPMPEVLSITLHPDWDSSVIEAGNDLAIIEFKEEVDPRVLRLPLYKATDEVGQKFVQTSFSPRVDPITGELSLAGWDTINNRFDGTTDLVNNLFGNTIALGNQLIFDYDNGTTVNDALGSLYGVGDTGVINEGTVSGGDSGGAALIDNKIAAVTSWGTTLGTPPDVLDGVNASYGEVVSSTRISTFIDWIEAVAGMVMAVELSGFATVIESTVTTGATNEALISGWDTEIEAYTGAYFETNGFAISLDIEVTTPPVMRVDLPFPATIIEAHTLTGTSIASDVRYSLNKEIEAFTGSQAELSGFNTAIESAVNSGSVINAALPFPTLSFEAVVGEASLVIITMRPPSMELTHWIADDINGFDTDIVAKVDYDCEVL